MNWYSKELSSNQALVIDEDTGDNVAVVYDAKNAELFVSALNALKLLMNARKESSQAFVRQSYMSKVQSVFDALDNDEN